jgi:hypothetical protein
VYPFREVPVKMLSTLGGAFSVAVLAAAVAMIAVVLIGTGTLPVWAGLPFLVGGLVLLFVAGRELARLTPSWGGGEECARAKA